MVSDHQRVNWKEVVRGLVLGNRLHELSVRQRLEQIRGNTFWDIGANIGFYSLCLHKKFSKVISVEPNPRTAYTLRRRINFFMVRNIEVKQFALSNSRGWMPFYSKKEWHAGPGIGNLLAGVGNNYTSDSLLPSSSSWRESPIGIPPEDEAGKAQPSFMVWTERFDDLNNDPVDLVKIDVEGAEFLVLVGMRNSLKTHLIRYLLVELHGNDSKNRLESLLSPYGYVLDWLDSRHVLARSR